MCRLLARDQPCWSPNLVSRNTVLCVRHVDDGFVKRRGSASTLRRGRTFVLQPTTVSFAQFVGVARAHALIPGEKLLALAAPTSTIHEFVEVAIKREIVQRPDAAQVAHAKVRDACGSTFSAECSSN